MNEVNWMQQGWECPKCGAVMSPHTDCCVNCRGNKGGFSITTIGDPAPTTDNNWTGYPPINDPSSACSSSSPLDPPYLLTKSSITEEDWEKAFLKGAKEGCLMTSGHIAKLKNKAED